MTALPPGSSRRSFDVQPRRVSMSGSGDGGGPSESVVRQQFGGSGGGGDGSLGTGRAPTEFGIDIPFSDWEIKPEGQRWFVGCLECIKTVELHYRTSVLGLYCVHAIHA
jgi:hypothetical protein